VTTFFATAPKVASVALTMRVALEAFGTQDDAWRQIVIFAALASIFLGAIAAYGQDNIKRLLAYSSINNVGFALIGLAAGNAQGASAVLFYMAVYVVMTVGAFLCVLWMRDADGKPVESIASLAGVPPLFGFWPKLLVFNAAIHQGLIALAVAGILGAVIGAYYYLKIVKVMYMDDPAAPYARVRQPAQGALVFGAALAVSPLGYLLIAPLGAFADRAAGTLF
jgi:NADH-quinone oxidoreductase subunit N